MRWKVGEEFIEKRFRKKERLGVYDFWELREYDDGTWWVSHFERNEREGENKRYILKFKTSKREKEEKSVRLNGWLLVEAPKIMKCGDITINEYVKGDITHMSK